MNTRMSLTLTLVIGLPVWAQSPPPAEVVMVGPQTRVTAPGKPFQVYKSQQRNGVTRYSDIKPEEGHYEVMQFNDCFACNPKSRVDWNTTGLFLHDYASTIQAAAHAYEVEPALIRALIHAESAFNPVAVSRKGAMGLTQLMPATARELGVGNPLLAEQNIFGGVKYLSSLLKQYKGNVALASAAYNAGAGAVQKYGGIPPYAETRAYVDRVQLLHQRYLSVMKAKGL